jgi:plasmid stability protein
MILQEKIMVDILIRDIDEKLDKALKLRALEHGCTREAEIKAILQASVIKHPKKRSLANALLEIPKLDTDVDELFARPTSSSRETDQ